MQLVGFLAAGEGLVGDVDLEGHQAFMIRNTGGTIDDRWRIRNAWPVSQVPNLCDFTKYIYS